jgi:hypothetical protein
MISFVSGILFHWKSSFLNDFSIFENYHYADCSMFEQIVHISHIWKNYEQWIYFHLDLLHHLRFLHWIILSHEIIIFNENCMIIWVFSFPEYILVKILTQIINLPDKFFVSPLASDMHWGIDSLNCCRCLTHSFSIDFSRVRVLLQRRWFPSSFEFYLEFFLRWDLSPSYSLMNVIFLNFFVVSTRVKESSWPLSFIDFSLRIIFILLFSVFMNAIFFESMFRYWKSYIFHSNV